MSIEGSVGNEQPGIEKVELDMSKPTPEDEPLVPVDVDNRPSSVVVSVRLNSEVAMELNAVARARGVRLSDVLRDAARTFAERQPEPTSTLRYQVQGVVEVAVGVPNWRSEPTRFGPGKPVNQPISWQPAKT